MGNVETFFFEEIFFERDPDRKIGGAGERDDAEFCLRGCRRGESQREAGEPEQSGQSITLHEEASLSCFSGSEHSAMRAGRRRFLKSANASRGRVIAPALA